MPSEKLREIYRTYKRDSFEMRIYCWKGCVGAIVYCCLLLKKSSNEIEIYLIINLLICDVFCESNNSIMMYFCFV